MVEGIVKKIMFTGIEKYAKNYGLTDLQVQIKVLNDENGSVTYKMCKNYVEEEDVRLLQIMDKKLDMFGYEALASPFLKRSLIESAEENEINVNQVCCFISKLEDKYPGCDAELILLEEDWEKQIENPKGKNIWTWVFGFKFTKITASAYSGDLTETDIKNLLSVKF